MSRRSRARQVAFQVLYQDDLNPRSNPAVSDELIEKAIAIGGIDRIFPQSCIRRAPPLPGDG